MEKTLGFVRIKDKFQITLSVLARKQLGVSVGDFLTLVEKDGVIQLKPQILDNKPRRDV